jgi:tetratricopeptide (TPR) repeat protein
MSRYFAEILAGCLLVVLTLAALGRVCGNDFVNYDDTDYVTDNRQVQAGLTAPSIAWAFTTTHAANWHPLTWLSLQLDHQLYGLAPWGYHLTNLLLHLANTLLLFVALRRMTGAVWRSAMVAALFAVHPLHVESVAWVAERKDVLSTLFWMLTLLAYVRYCERPGLGRYLPVPLFLALGLMAKPMLVTLPCVLMLLDYWPLRRLRLARPLSTNPEPPTEEIAAPYPPASWRFLLLEKLPLFALVAASCAVTVYAQQAAMAALVHVPIPSRVANALTAYAGYLGKMIWPVHLAALYPIPRHWYYWKVFVAVGLLLSITGLVLRRAGRQPYLLVGWLWYVGTLVPVIGLVQVGKQQMADRYSYIPLIGLFLALVWGAADALASRSAGRRWLLVLAALVLLPCVLFTWAQAGYWHDADALWEHAYLVTEENPDAAANAGAALENRGQVGQAIALYREALRVDPDHELAHTGLGRALEKQGKWEEAADHFAALVRLNPGQAKGYLLLGSCLEKQGRLEEARANYEAALLRDPGNAVIHNNLGVVYGRLSKPQEAIGHFTAALDVNPNDAQAHSNLGSVLFQQGQVTVALEHFAAALRIDPHNATTHCNLATALLHMGKDNEAAKEYEAALRLQPDFRRAQQGLDEIQARVLPGERNDDGKR